MNRLFSFRFMSCAVLLILALAAPAHADGSINVGTGTTQIDLAKLGSPVLSIKPSITVHGMGDSTSRNLVAKGPGPNYYWSLFAIHNSADHPLDLVLTADAQKFTGSGLVFVKPAGNAIVNAVALGGGPLLPVKTLEPHAYAIHVLSQQTFNIAVESLTPEADATLWQRQVLEDSQAAQLFVYGLILGIGFLLVLGLIAIFFTRFNRIFLVGILFALASILFIAFDSSLLPEPETVFPNWAINASVVRGILENILTASLGACILAFSGIRKYRPLIGYGVVTLVAFSLGNIGLAFVDAATSASLARLSFAVAVVAGFIITALYRHKIVAMVDPGMVFWSLLFGWMLFAAVASISTTRNSNTPLLLSAGLAIVVVSMAVELFKFAMVQRPMMEPRLAPFAVHEDIFVEDQPQVQVPTPIFDPPAIEIVNRVAQPLSSPEFLWHRLEHELTQAKDTSVRVMLAELRGFQELHESVDDESAAHLLHYAGDCIGVCLAPDEVAAHISSGRFMILAVETAGHSRATEIAIEIARAVSVPSYLNRQKILLGVTCGISEPSAAGVSAEQMMQQATVALLEAERDNATYTVFEEKAAFAEQATPSPKLETSLEYELRHALARNELEIHYHPIRQIKSMELVGLKAMAFWNHPTRGRIEGAELIALGEGAGLGAALGHMVLANAMRALSNWQAEVFLGRPLFVGVGVPESLLLDPGFSGYLGTIIGLQKIPPTSLHLEIAQAVIIRYPAETAKLSAVLHALGVGLTFDQYSANAAGLAQLRAVAFNTLKLDAELVRPDQLDTRHQTIISSMADFAHQKGMTIVGQGIETRDQLDMLQVAGCDYGQGFLMGHPMAQTAVASLIAGLNLPALPKLPDSTPLPGEPDLAAAAKQLQQRSQNLSEKIVPSNQDEVLEEHEGDKDETDDDSVGEEFQPSEKIPAEASDNPGEILREWLDGHAPLRVDMKARDPRAAPPKPKKST